MEGASSASYWSYLPVDNDDYDSFPYSRGKNKELLTHDICAHLEVSTQVEAKDDRFYKSDPFGMTGYVEPIMRVHACAALRLSLWCVKPGSNNRTFRNVVHTIAMPVAITFDALFNLSALVVKIALTPILLTGAVLHKCISSSEVALGATFSACGKHFSKTADSVFFLAIEVFALKLGIALLSTAGLFVMPTAAYNVFADRLFVHLFLTPANSPIYMLASTCLFRQFQGPSIGGNLLAPGYIMHNENSGEDEYVLDQGRVTYLQQKCGWHDVSKEQMREHFRPAEEPSTKISFKIDGESILYNFQWTETRTTTIVV